MKKILFVFMTIVLVLISCSCGENNDFKEGNLLYDLGAKSIDDIGKVEFLYEEYQGYHLGKIEISQKKDIELLCDYVYSLDWPDDKLHELFLYPTNSIYVTIGGMQYQLYFSDDGGLTTVPGNNMKKMQTYKAKNGEGITKSVWEEFIEKYQ